MTFTFCGFQNWSEWPFGPLLSNYNDSGRKGKLAVETVIFQNQYVSNVDACETSNRILLNSIFKKKIAPNASLKNKNESEIVSKASLLYKMLKRKPAT